MSTIFINMQTHGRMRNRGDVLRRV